MVDLNITLWIQLANFLVTLVVLNYLLISPIRKIIRKRKDNVEGLIGEIEAFTAEKQQLLDAEPPENAAVICVLWAAGGGSNEAFCFFRQ